MATMTIKFYSPSLQTKTNIQVIVPTPESTLFGHQETLQECAKTGPFPVLYLLHGTTGDESDWVRFSRIEDYARKYQLIIVMPNCENSSYRNTPAGKAYYTYVTEELRTMINWMFPVNPDRDHTFIAGLSMGGSGAFMLGMSRPDIYSHLASLSGGFGGLKDMRLKPGGFWAWAFDPNEDLENGIDNPVWLSNKLINEKIDYPNFYMCCGTEDFLYEANCELRAHLDSIGFRYTYHEQPGIHNWDFWDDEIKRILEWLPVLKRGETGIL